MASSLEDLIMGGPPAATSSSGPLPGPIGIPESFRPQAPNPRPPYTNRSNGLLPQDNPTVLANVPAVREPYYDGAEYGPRTLSAEKRAQLQQAMAQAGLIGPKQSYRLGVWDEVSVKAYRDVLSYANQGGIDADTAITELVSSPFLKGDGTSGQLDVDPGKVTQLTDAVTLDEQVQQAARQELGRKLQSGEAARFATLYRAMQARDASTRDAAQTAVESGQDVTVTDVPSVDVAASQFIDSEFAQEAAGHSTYGYLQALKELVG